MSHTLSMDFISCVKGDYLIQKVSNASHSKRARNGVNWPLRHYCRPKRTMVTKEEISYKFLCDFKPHNSQTLNTLSRIVIKRRQTRRSGNGTQQKWKLTKKNRKLKKIIFIAFSSPSPQKKERNTLSSAQWWPSSVGRFRMFTVSIVQARRVASRSRLSSSHHRTHYVQLQPKLEDENKFSLLLWLSSN